MEQTDYIYQNRIVAFIDILGYREKLVEFEADAKPKENDQGEMILTSEKVNEFLSTFKSVTKALDEKNIRYYLFSDNICISADYIENPRLSIDILFTISDLFYEFAQKGYFLRGAIEVGKFIDEPMIALGNPLTKAYLAESKTANYPRILISHEYYKTIADYLGNQGATHFDITIQEHLIYRSCELYYLNVFYSVFQASDKVAYFSTIKQKITDNLQANAEKEHLFIKYDWLAGLYNRFLETYTSQLIYTEVDEPEGATIASLNQLKITRNAV